MRIVSEQEFSEALYNRLSEPSFHQFGVVTGPGRSGAIAAVYASHFLKIPFIPCGSKAPHQLEPLLIIDTAEQTGKTLRKVSKKYDYVQHETFSLYKEPPRIGFWYEAVNPTPQRYKHERENVSTELAD